MYPNFVNIIYLLQFLHSVYYIRTLESGSWYDAEKVCIRHGGHLWSVNGHSEWWNVYQMLFLFTLLDTFPDIFVQAWQLQQSTLFPIGLQSNAEQV